MRRALASAFLLLALVSPAARARDPITPLSDIHGGLACTARTVVRGTDISTFDVQVLDVVADTDGTGPRILVRVSGPAVEGTGIAEGFSGSPVFCPDRNGAIGNAGAISATVGQYGEDVGLVTPIEQMLNLPTTPPSGTRRLPQLLREARPLASPLVLSGLSQPLGDLMEQTALAHGRALVAAPAGPLGSFAPQPLVPGASMAVALSAGAVASGAIGTVTYRDGNVVYGFGHPFESAGRRSLPLQDAYVFTVIGNPVDAGQLTSYKLAAPGHTLGTLTNDALDGVVGTVGAAPPTVPLTVRVKDLDTGAFVQQRTDVADETDLGNPDGASALSGVASLAVAQGVTSAFDGSPAQETGRMCLTAHLRELAKPLRWCNRYVVQGALQAGAPAPLALTMGSDAGDALDVFANARFRALHVTQVDATARVERGMTLATMLGADVARPVVRPGQRVRVALRVRVWRGPLATLRFTLRIPHGISPGPHTLRLIGTPAESASGTIGGALSILLDLFGSDGGGGIPPGAQTMAQATAAYLGTAQFDGVHALLGSRAWDAYLNRQVRIDGRASVDLIVASPRHRRHAPPLPPIGRILTGR